jgi:hypothetical protein
LIHLVRVNLFFNPLWDPLRDLVTQPVTPAELVGLYEIAQRLVDATEQALARAEAGETIR